MRLPFLDRKQEATRIRKAIDAREASLVVLYGRRRCGKSRLLVEALKERPSIYYVGDERESTLQRRGLAAAIGRSMPRFDAVEYPEWDALFDRFWREAPAGITLSLDEFPYLVVAAPEVPSLLQKRIDADHGRRIHVALCGSSQRMMHGLVLDSGAPLYGRAKEILKITPLPAGWIGDAFTGRSAVRLIEAYAAWGGIPRYWELANEFRNTGDALTALVLDPLGTLHEEADRLLLEDLWETAQAASVLSLIGDGCSKLSEIAGRLGKPATSLSRPLARLQDLGLVEREVPFGVSPRDSKRSRYSIADPFLLFWFRFASPRRSMIEARQTLTLGRELRACLPVQTGQIWEKLARHSVSHLKIGGQGWRPASRWWGTGVNGAPIEIDIVALSEDERSVLVGEVKLSLAPKDWAREAAALSHRAHNLPLAAGRRVVPAIWCTHSAKAPQGIEAIDAETVLAALR